MTTREERSRSLLQAEQFLVDLAAGRLEGVPDNVRARAHRLLRHRPSASDLQHIAEAEELSSTSVLSPPLLSATFFRNACEEHKPGGAG